MIPKAKKDELVQLYIQQGAQPIRPLCRELGISPKSIARYARTLGLHRSHNHKTAKDRKWARAIAIGKVVA